MPDDGSSIDVEGLLVYLDRELEPPVVNATVRHDGLNLTVSIATPSDEEAYVLRRPNKLRESEIFNAAADEFRLLECLAETRVPVPEPVLFCDNESVLGGPFGVYTHLDGTAVPLGTALPTRYQHPLARRRVATALIDTLADVHSLDSNRFADVCETVTPRAQLHRDAERLDAATSAIGRDFQRLRTVRDWLQANAPAEPSLTLVHGDFRPGNVLFAGDTHPEISGILDWETAIVGDPLMELGYLLLRWRDEGDPTPPLDVLEARYPDSHALAELREMNEHGLAPFTSRAGSPTRRDLVTRYETRSGYPFEEARFYLASAAFGLASVWADLHRHSIEAGVPSHRLPYVEYVAALAETIIEGDFRL